MRNTFCSQCCVCCIAESVDLTYTGSFTGNDDNIALTRSYKCNVSKSYNFDVNNSAITATLTMSLQLQAFKFIDTNGTFGSGI